MVNKPNWLLFFNPDFGKGRESLFVSGFLAADVMIRQIPNNQKVVNKQFLKVIRKGSK